MYRVQSILPRVLHKRGLGVQARASQVTHVAEKWLKLALPHLAAFVKVDTLQHSVLTISCTHSIAAQECLPLLPSLREFLGRECKGSSVEDIRMIRSR